MKVLTIVHQFLPKHAAGSEYYTYYLAKALQARGHDLHLLTTEIDPQDERRKICRLTLAGREDAKIVEKVGREIANALVQIDQEIGVDLMDAMEKAEKSLSRIPLQER